MRERPPWRSVLLGLGLALFGGVGALITLNAVVLHEGDARERSFADTPQADAVLVLGAGVRPDGSPSDILTDRLETALALYEAGRAPYLLVSGDHGREEYDEPGAMRAWLLARGVPDDAIVMDHAGFDTYSSVWRAKNVFGVRRAVVVTQAFHLPRALFLAGRLGVEASGVRADRRRYRSAVWSAIRETASRAKAWVDVTTDRSPHFAEPDGVWLTER